MARATRACAAALPLLFFFAGAAGADPVETINGATQIYVSAFGALEDEGAIVLPGGTAEVEFIDALPSPFVFYDITSVDEVAEQIFHDGSLLTISANSNSVALSDFLIDVDAGFVLADVASLGTNLMGAPIFALDQFCSLDEPCIGLDGTSTIEGVGLTLTAAAASVLTGELGLPDLTDAPIGVANSTYTLIPEPGTAALMGLGLLGLARAGRRP
ncbi:MAG: PEP-CTERM sorting domain-containing protein [Myxococcota bacterium]|nr:PEP-CTERM sorting domain-containing protein [Myxococcota bacterium]